MAKKKTPPCVVIDASVGGQHKGSAAGQCRRFLEEFQSTSLKSVVCDSLHDEWARNGTKFAIRWRASMKARRREIRISDCEDLDDFVNRIDSSEAKPKVKAAAAKDAHLVTVCLKHSFCVASADGAARQAFVDLKPSISELKNVSWFEARAQPWDIQAWLGSIRTRGSNDHKL